MYYYDDYVLSQNMAQRSRLCIHSQGRKFKDRPDLMISLEIRLFNTPNLPSGSDLV